jgi:methionine sulfoxide reductase heme-binding subunit
MSAGSDAPRRGGGGMRVRLPAFPPILLYLVGFQPAIWTFWLGFQDKLGADPLRTLEWTLGLWALRFLIAALCITPLRDWRLVNLLRYRRALGLLAFWYALLHLGTWLILDQGLDPQAIVRDILRRPYITIGMLAFAILVPLAVTSNAWSIRKLGAMRWNRLHRLVYLATAAAALHFVMVRKSWPAEPLIYAAIVAALLAYRAWKAWRPPPGRERATPARSAPAGSASPSSRSA